MTFYFVRHGQTDANARGTLAGSGLDVPLNLVGHDQARALAARLARAIGHPVHRIVTSSMIRARETAGYLADALQLPLETEPDLREWHLGEWEGKPSAEFLQLILGTGDPRGGESRKVFYERIERAWRTHHHEQNPYVLVSHGGVWLALQDLLNLPRFKIENCQLVRVAREGAGWNATILP